jgi:hypothetical protein
MATSANTSAYSTSPCPASHLRNNRRSRTTIRAGGVPLRGRGPAGVRINAIRLGEAVLLQSSGHAPGMQDVC